MIPKPVVLIILDGWGHRTDPEHNAIAAAHTPNWDRLWAEQPHTLIATSGEAVGLPEGQMGNSEVGHLNLGSGRIVYQDYTRINKAIDDGSFYDNAVLTGAAKSAKARGGALHLLGLASPGGVHSHADHLRAMIELARRCGVGAAYLHAFLDGRDTAPKSARATLEELDRQLKTQANGRIATITGRYYAMDRDERWARTQAAFDALVHGRAEYRASDPIAALDAAYERGESDEFVKPIVIASDGEQPVTIEEGDAVVVMNFRADRARQITRALLDPGFDAFDRGTTPRLAALATLTQYHPDFDCPVAFAPVALEGVLGETLARHKLHQLRLAETEKYAHVTFFFNGTDQPFSGEDRILIPSPKVATYDLKPEMSAPEVTDALLKAIDESQHEVIVCNYANADMVGHSGDFDAAVEAVECLDQCLGRIVERMTQSDGALLITADHGNVEQMQNEETGQAHTAHTTGPVPLILLGAGEMTLRSGGALQDVAPTLLALLGIDAPAQMTGRSLLESEKSAAQA